MGVLGLLVPGLLVLVANRVSCEYGMIHVTSEKSNGNGKDYCILFNSQWAHLPHDLAKASMLQLQNQTPSVLCSPSDVPYGGFSNRIPMVMRGNCTFYDKVRLAQTNGARGLLIVSRENLVPPAGNQTQYEEIDIPVALLSHSDMLDIGKTFGRSVKVAMYASNEPVLDYNMVIIFVMAVGTVAIGGYWAGSRDVKKRYMKHKRDDGAEKHDDETVDVTPIMICVFVVMCCSMLVLLYFFYDYLVYVIISIFCLAASIGLYSCLCPFVRRLPFGKCRLPDNNLPYFHKRPQVRMLLLAVFCISISVVWGVFRNEDQWAWILQDLLGIAFCLYMLKTIRLPTFKACTLLLVVLFIYDVFFVFITPYLTKTGESIMVEVAAGPSSSSTQEKLPMVLKVPRLNFSPLALCDRPFSLLGFGDILVPGLLVAYCHRFDIQMQSSRIYFVACTIAPPPGLMAGTAARLYLNRWAAAKPEKRPVLCIRGVIKPMKKEVKEFDIPGVEPITFAGRMHFLPWLAEPKFEKWKSELHDPFHCKGPRLEEMPLHKTKPCYTFHQRIRALEAYGIGLLVTFVALALMQMGQPALLYLVPCTLITSFAVALLRKELTMFWTGSGFVKELPLPPIVMAPVSCLQPLNDSSGPPSQSEREDQQINPTLLTDSFPCLDEQDGSKEAPHSQEHSEQPASPKEDEPENQIVEKKSQSD